MRIAMIGTGYVGLVSGACFADFGHHVTCVDKDEGKIASLRRGEIPIFEPGLDALVAANVKARRLDFTTELKAPVAEADAVFIAVGTPSRRGDGHADSTHDEQNGAQPFEHLAGGPEILRDQQRVTRLQMHRQHALYSSIIDDARAAPAGEIT